MAALTLEGRISAKLAPQSGQSARGAWARQDFVLEYPDGNFTSNACLTAWGQDKVAELDKFRVGDPVKVSFNVRAREYSGRWYNDLRIWKIEAPSADSAQQGYAESGAPQGYAPAGSPQGFPAPDGGFAPSGNAPQPPAYSAPDPSLEDMTAEDLPEDDLPF